MGLRERIPTLPHDPSPTQTTVNRRTCSPLYHTGTHVGASHTDSGTHVTFFQNATAAPPPLALQRPPHYCPPRPRLAYCYSKA